MMFSTLKSAWIWFAVTAVIVLWLPLLSVIRLFDRDPARYRTGRWFRRLGVALTLINPAWRLTLSGATIADPRNPYVVVSNHQSLADIPLISHVPWEMKWVAKEELFRVPFVGWMMKLAGDIPLNRKSARSGARALLQASRYLQKRCSVMFFPEGTRSPDGRVGRFNDGAFHLAIRSGVPILPLAVDGSSQCLPKSSWRFGRRQDIRLHILPPVATEGLTAGDASALRDTVRRQIIGTVAAWRGVAEDVVDSLRSPG
jgi:1-acyl-sn-glycerol-3-phosphate acyltransferase